MNVFRKRQPRYNDVGKIEAPQICALPGMLVNISKDGCKVRFPFAIALDLEDDYELNVFLASKQAENARFSLLCHPCWHKISRTSTEIGFSILRCPDYHNVSQYVKKLEDNSNEAEYEALGMVCNFA